MEDTRQLPVCAFVRVHAHASLSDGIYAESKDSIQQVIYKLSVYTHMPGHINT